MRLIPASRFDAGRRFSHCSQGLHRDSFALAAADIRLRMRHRPGVAVSSMSVAKDKRVHKTNEREYERNGPNAQHYEGSDQERYPSGHAYHDNKEEEGSHMRDRAATHAMPVPQSGRMLSSPGATMFRSTVQ